eukprot:3625362-Amphidinium_carterae.2
MEMGRTCDKEEQYTLAAAIPKLRFLFGSSCEASHSLCLWNPPLLRQCDLAIAVDIPVQHDGGEHQLVHDLRARKVALQLKA